jgi:REP element-mobilizing transposase RayT
MEEMNHRNAFQDYRAPAFYMITMTTLNRRPLFAACADNLSTLNEDGWLVYNLWHAMPKTYPELALSTLVIMPDHLHGIVRVTERMAQSVGVPLRAFKSQVTSALRKKYENPTLAVWNPGYHDLCVWRKGALKAYTHYLCDNPRRYCLRKTHPDLFVRVDHLKHSRLPPEQVWNGYGNRFLLDRPEIVSLRVSRRASPEEIAGLCKSFMEQAAQGAVVISPFISPGEKAVVSAILEADRGDVILMKAGGFPDGYKPSGRYYDLCAQGRLLILTPYPDCSSPPALTREQCGDMNTWCAWIAGSKEMEDGKR